MQRLFLSFVVVFSCCLATASAQDAKEYVNRGNAWGNKGEYEKAIAEYTDALGIDPRCAEAYCYRGVASRQMGDYDAAIEDYTQALTINPDYALAYNNRGNALRIKGEHDKAMVDFNRALALDPNMAEAYSNRGLAWDGKGDYGKAVADYDKALALDPQLAAAHTNLAFLYAACPDAKYRDGEKAFASASKACRLTGGTQWDYIDTLAAAYAEYGDFTNALKWQAKAIEMAPDDKSKQECRSRLQLYARNMPYRELLPRPEKAWEAPTLVGPHSGPSVSQIPSSALPKSVPPWLREPQPSERQTLLGNKTAAYPRLRAPAAEGGVVTPVIEGWQRQCDQGNYGEGLPPQLKMPGEGTGAFTLMRNDNDFVASLDIPAADGRMSTKGKLINDTTERDSHGRKGTYFYLSGEVWTPRVRAIGNLDLTGTGKITTRPGFNFAAFKASPDVIPFANGYAVNLFGQKLDEGGVVDAHTHPKGNYVSDDGTPLYGRLVRESSGGLEEIVLARLVPVWSDVEVQTPVPHATGVPAGSVTPAVATEDAQWRGAANADHKKAVSANDSIPTYGGQAAPSVYGSSIITFDNQSGDPALVRLIGPTRGEVFVPNSGRSSINRVAAGNYAIYIRYGNPGRYRYTRGDRFDVRESGLRYSMISITLHTVVSGNYGSRVSSEDEFNQALR